MSRKGAMKADQAAKEGIQGGRRWDSRARAKSSWEGIRRAWVRRKPRAWE